MIEVPDINDIDISARNIGMTTATSASVKARILLMGPMFVSLVQQPQLELIVFSADFPAGIDKSVFGPSFRKKFIAARHPVLEKYAAGLYPFRGGPAPERNQIIIGCRMSVAAV
jgi:hypothetical protein